LGLHYPNLTDFVRYTPEMASSDIPEYLRGLPTVITQFVRYLIRSPWVGPFVDVDGLIKLILESNLEAEQIIQQSQ